MAGTRLFIQAAVAIEFFLLVSVAVHFGLCQQGDVLCSSLFGSKDQLLDLGTVKSRIKIPFISVVVPANDVTQWKAAFARLSDPDQNIEVVTNEHHVDICRGNYENYVRQHHIWICPIQKATIDAARMEIISDGTALFYSGGDDNSVVRALFPSSSKRPPLHRQSLQFTLVTEDGKSWNSWSQALTKLAETVPFFSLPCLHDSPSVRLKVDGALSEGARPIKQVNNTVHQISITDAQKYLSAQTRNESLLKIAIYVPSREKMPLVVQKEDQRNSDTSSTAFAVSNEMVSIVSRIPLEEEPLESFTQVLRLALEHSVPFLHSKCLGLPPLKQIHISPKGVLPSWQVQATWQRLLHDVHERAYNEVVLVHGFLIDFSASVDATGQVR